VEGSSFALDEFLDMWQKALPEGIKADISHLDGLAMVIDDVVKRFTEPSLPNNIQVYYV
jgi:hypothetical protein